MSKFKIGLLSLFVMLVCNFKVIYSQDTTIVGKASNAKYGAVVITASNDVYYLDTLKSWSSQFINKSVKVSGRIITKKIKKQKIISGTITSPNFKVIKKPKIEVLSND